MLLKEIKNIAVEHGVITNGMRTKGEVIHAIQQNEGNQPCYATKADCDNVDCAWHMDCVNYSKRKNNGSKH